MNQRSNSNNIHYTDDELIQIADRSLARIRSGEPMMTIETLPSRAEKRHQARGWKEGGGSPNRLNDVST